MGAATGRTAALLPFQASLARFRRVSMYVQAIATVPDGVDSAPYLAALVSSSCIAMAIATAASGSSTRGRPSNVIRAGTGSCGATAERTDHALLLDRQRRRVEFLVLHGERVGGRGVCHRPPRRRERQGARKSAWSTRRATALRTLPAPRYLETTGVLTFNDQETVKTITIPISDDAARSGNETVQLTLSKPKKAVQHRQLRRLTTKTMPTACSVHRSRRP